MLINRKALGKVIAIFAVPISIMLGVRFLPTFWVGVIAGTLFIIFILLSAWMLYDIFNTEDKYE